MIERVLLTFSFLAVTCSVRAAWDVGAGLEDYRWKEYPTNISGTPRESGTRAALFVNWTQEGNGALFAWRAKLYGGTVNYDTFQMNAPYDPVSTKTDYNGAASEGQFYYRTNIGSRKMDYLVGLGLDAWRRSIRNSGGDQIEDYSIWFMRAGLRLGKSRNEAGLHGELGLKYPVSTRENAHLDSMSYTSNPKLSPKGAISGYAEIGYRINARFDVLGYYDSWRFRQSADVMATNSSGISYYIYQPKSNMDALGAKLLVSF